MEFKNNSQDLQTVFEKKWKANHYNQNGMKKNIEQNQKRFNRMYHIKTEEEKRKEILEANSVQGRVSRLEENVRAASSFMNKNNFR